MKRTVLFPIIYCFIIFSVRAVVPAPEKASLHGSITDKMTGEPLIGVAVYFPELNNGSVTDEKGNYRITGLPSGKFTLQVTYVGHQSIVEPVDLQITSELNFSLEEASAKVDEVVVTATAGATQSVRTPTPIVVIPKTELLYQTSTNIIDALASQPGVSEITTGSGISKPGIRGLGYNRVVTVNDGVRQEGQQWGDEHGIEIDEQTVDRVELLKGPASLMYGSDAMAGVINFLPASPLPEGKIEGNIFTNYQTNNGLAAYSLDLAGHQNAIVWNIRYSDKMAHDYSDKYDGYVYGSGFKEQALTGLIGVNKSWGYSHLTLSAYSINPNIISGSRDSITGQFTKPIVMNGSVGEAIASGSDFTGYGSQIPYQHVQHYKAVWNNDIMFGKGSLHAIFGYQQNRRQEFDDILNPDQYGLYFQLHTFNYDVHYVLPSDNGFTTSFGVNGMYQQSLNKGIEFLVPAYNLFDVGLFALTKKTFGKFDVSGGLRFDNRHEHGDDLYDPAAYHRFTAFTDDFKGISGSLGASYRMNKILHFKLNLSRGFRAPSINELASNGVHDGTLRYEIGNPDLKAESSWQTDGQIGLSSRYVSVEADLFTNRISNYIFSSKLRNVAGSDSITSGYQTYKFMSGNAHLWGGELSIDIHPIDVLHFENSFSFVNSIQTNQPDSSKYLPMTPAPKWRMDLRYDLSRHGKIFHNAFVNIGFDHYFTQDRYYAADGTETPTPAYTLLYAGIGTDIMHKKKTKCTLIITGDNLTDVAYQSHLSRLKYLDVNNVTGRTGVFNPGRNISFKLIIPVNIK
jgi:iron complex outermembrane receptor protein